jgi:hypothetical protein
VGEESDKRLLFLDTHFFTTRVGTPDSSPYCETTGSEWQIIVIYRHMPSERQRERLRTVISQYPIPFPGEALIKNQSLRGEESLRDNLKVTRSI